MSDNQVSKGKKKYRGSFRARYDFHKAISSDAFVFTLEPAVANPRVTLEKTTTVEGKIAGDVEGHSGAAPQAPKYLMMVKVIITTQGYPTRKINLDIIDKIENKLLEMTNQSAEYPAPFVKVHQLAEYTRSSITVDCIGVNVADFFKPLDGFSVNKLKIRVLPKQILTERVRMSCSITYVAGLRLKTFLDQLQKCYPNLNVPEWYVIRSIVKDSSLNVTIIMDRISADYIAECGFILRWVDPNNEAWYSDEFE